MREKRGKKQERRNILKRGVLPMQRDIGTQCPTSNTEVPPAQAGEVSHKVRESEARMILEGQVKREKPETATC